MVVIKNYILLTMNYEPSTMNMNHEPSATSTNSRIFSLHSVSIAYMRKYYLLPAFLAIVFFSCTNKPQYDTIIRNGMIYDGTGGNPFAGDIGINADTIAFIGNLSGVKAVNELDAKGMAVSPGFVDVQSQSMETLIQDGRSMSAIKQGVTLEVFGEGESEGLH